MPVSENYRGKEYLEKKSANTGLTAAKPPTIACKTFAIAEITVDAAFAIKEITMPCVLGKDLCPRRAEDRPEVRTKCQD